MFKKGLLLISLVFIVFAGYNQVQAMSSTPQSAKYQLDQHQQIENVKIIKEFNVPKLDRTQDILVYRPLKYKQTDKSYPVLYLFADGEKQLEKLMSRLMNKKAAQQHIFVGLTAENPQVEFAPWKYSTSSRYIRKYKGDKYAQFVVNKLKPYIDKHYRTLKGRKHTGVMGKDFGGLFSLYLGIRYQHLVSKAAAVSPELWIYYYGEEFKEFKIGKSSPMRFYLFTEKEETDNPAWNAVHRHNIKKFHKLLQEKGFNQVELILADKGSSNQFKEGVKWLYN